jgi:hypothetical protein
MLLLPAAMKRFLYTGHPVWYLVHCIRRKTLLFVVELVVHDFLTVYISKLMKNVHKNNLMKTGYRMYLK